MGTVDTRGDDRTKQAEPASSPASALDAETTIRRVGGQIRKLRGARRLTLQDVADRTGVSVSMLSMLERGVAGASIGTLVAVASALGVHMTDLFEHDEAPPSPLRRFADQVRAETAAGVFRRVAHHDAAKGVEMVVNEYAPGTASATEAVHHPGTEYGVLVAGSLVVEVDGVRYELETGDAITYASGRPHLFRNEGTVTARAVWLNLDA